VEHVRELTGGLGVHSVLECVGVQESVLTVMDIAQVEQVEAELPELGALVGEKAVERVVVTTVAMSFRMIRTPWFRVVRVPACSRKRGRAGSRPLQGSD
jgi:alkylated DNA nucleotide flippase Atl1